MTKVRRHGRLLLGLVVGGALALLGVHGATWFYVSGRILDGIPAFTAQAAREGWVLAAGPPHRAGWPWAAAVRVPGLTATRPLGGGGVVWTAEHLDVAIAPGDPRHLRIEPGGASTLRLGQGTPIDLRARAAMLLLPLDGVGPGRLAIHDLVAGTAEAGLRVAGVEARIEPGVVAGTVAGLTTVPPLAAPFEGGAQLTGRVVVTPPFPAAATPRDSAASWQAGGGRVTMPELLLDWGPLRVEGTVAGGLDAQLQPVGEARLRVAGALAVLEAAGRAGLVQPGPASAARAVLTLLTMAAPGGVISLPVVLQDRTLTVAQFALLRLPVLAWSPD